MLVCGLVVLNLVDSLILVCVGKVLFACFGVAMMLSLCLRCEGLPLICFVFRVGFGVVFFGWVGCCCLVAGLRVYKWFWLQVWFRVGFDFRYGCLIWGLRG